MYLDQKMTLSEFFSDDTVEIAASHDGESLLLFKDVCQTFGYKIWVKLTEDFIPLSFFRNMENIVKYIEYIGLNCLYESDSDRTHKKNGITIFSAVDSEQENAIFSLIKELHVNPSDKLDDQQIKLVDNIFYNYRPLVGNPLYQYSNMIIFIKAVRCVSPDLAKELEVIQKRKGYTPKHENINMYLFIEHVLGAYDSEDPFPCVRKWINHPKIPS